MVRLFFFLQARGIFGRWSGGLALSNQAEVFTEAAYRKESECEQVLHTLLGQGRKIKPTAHTQMQTHIPPLSQRLFSSTISSKSHPTFFL